MPWYLYLALKQLFPTGKRFPFFTAISMLGVALGVAILLITTSVMAGFAYEIRKMIVDTQGEVQVRGHERLIDKPAELQRIVNGIEGVVASTPFAEGPAMLLFGQNSNQKTAFPNLRGFDFQQVEKVLPIRRYIPLGSLDAIDDDGVILSAQLASFLGAGIGDVIEVWSPLVVLEFVGRGDVVKLPHELKVVGIFEIGHKQLDSSLVLVTLRTMQDIYGLGRGVHGLDLKLKDGVNPDEVAWRINKALPIDSDAHAQSWLQTQKLFLFILTLEKNMISFLLMFIIVVAAFSVTSSLLISVVRKTREIGLLGALGGNPLQVAACFCFQGLLIGSGGALAGLGLGFTALYYRNDVVQMFTRLTNSEGVLEQFYELSQLPSHSEPRDVVMIVVATIAISTLAGMLPAWRAAKLKPVEALRSE